MDDRTAAQPLTGARQPTQPRADHHRAIGGPVDALRGGRDPHPKGRAFAKAARAWRRQQGHLDPRLGADQIHRIGDGLPDEGEVPFACLPPEESITKRLPLLAPCLGPQ